MLDSLSQVVFRAGEGALQVLPPLVDALPEAKLNLVSLFLTSSQAICKNSFKFLERDFKEAKKGMLLQSKANFGSLGFFYFQMLLFVEGYIHDGVKISI